MESAAKEAAKETLGQFPIDDLFFILTSGLFVVMAFPFDIFNFDFSLLPTFSITDLPKLASSNFAPFINLKYLGVQFPTYLIMLVLLSIPFGMMIYLLDGAYQRLNYIVMRGRVKERFCKSEIGEVPLGVILDFYEWLREKKMGKYASLLWSMKSTSTGLLYGGETFILFVSISMLLARRVYWEWFVFSFILTFFLYAIHIIYQRRYNTLFDALYNTYQATLPRAKCETKT